MPNIIKLPKPWKELVEAYGGRNRFSEKIGVTGVTIRRWAMGESQMPLTTKKEILRLANLKKIDMSNVLKG